MYINEIFPNPKGRDKGKEWIEIKNTYSENHQYSIQINKCKFPIKNFNESIQIIYPPCRIPNTKFTIKLNKDHKEIQAITVNKAIEQKSYTHNGEYWENFYPTPNQENWKLIKPHYSFKLEKSNNIDLICNSKQQYNLQKRLKKENIKSIYKKNGHYLYICKDSPPPPKTKNNLINNNLLIIVLVIVLITGLYLRKRPYLHLKSSPKKK